MTGYNWGAKTNFRCDTGACVEAALNPDGNVGIRDSENLDHVLPVVASVFREYVVSVCDPRDVVAGSDVPELVIGGAAGPEDIRVHDNALVVTHSSKENFLEQVRTGKFNGLLAGVTVDG